MARSRPSMVSGRSQPVAAAKGRSNSRKIGSAAPTQKSSYLSFVPRRNEAATITANPAIAYQSITACFLPQLSHFPVAGLAIQLFRPHRWGILLRDPPAALLDLVAVNQHAPAKVNRTQHS